MESSNGINWILVCVEKPKDCEKPLDWTEWLRFLESLKSDAKITASAKKLTENLWLFPLRKGLRAHNLFLDAAHLNHLKTKVFLLESEPLLCDADDSS